MYINKWITIKFKHTLTYTILIRYAKSMYSTSGATEGCWKYHRRIESQIKKFRQEFKGVAHKEYADSKKKWHNGACFRKITLLHTKTYERLCGRKGLYKLNNTRQILSQLPRAEKISWRSSNTESFAYCKTFFWLNTTWWVKGLKDTSATAHVSVA